MASAEMVEAAPVTSCLDCLEYPVDDDLVQVGAFILQLDIDLDCLPVAYRNDLAL